MRKRTTTALLCLLVASPGLRSQDAVARPPAPATKAEQAFSDMLAKAAVATRVEFQARWLWADTAMMGQQVAGGARNVRVQVVRPVQTEIQAASGTAYRDALALQVEGRDARRILTLGRHCLESMPDKPWQLVDRRKVGTNHFLPDPATIFLALRSAGFRVLDRSIGEHDGHAVETYAINLNREQCAAFVRSGAINDPDPKAQAFRRIAARAGADPNAIGDVIFDLAIDVDVASQQIRRLHVRTLTVPIDTGEMLQRFRGFGRQRRGAQADNVESEAEPEEAAPSEPVQVPTEFERGLPVRVRDGRELRWR
ncbi:MAG: hypothetical protein AB8H80_19465, partial [Planctomycetota bacterium]